MSEYDRLIKNLSRFPSPKWVNQYFDLLKQLLTYFEIENDDQRIGLSLRSEGGMPVNFGQRYVLQPLRNYHLGILVPADFSEKAVGGKITWEFTNNRIIDARLIAIPFNEGKQLPPNLYTACLKACTEILNKTTRSGYRKYHSPLVYDFTMEPAVRTDIIAEVNWQ